MNAGPQEQMWLADSFPNQGGGGKKRRKRQSAVSTSFLEFATVLFMVTCFYLRSYLSMGEKMLFILYKRKTQVTIWVSSFEMGLKNVYIISVSLIA